MQNNDIITDGTTSFKVVDLGGGVKDLEKRTNAVENTVGAADYVVEYQRGLNWFRRWKSGWLEQGGKGTSEVGNNRLYTLNQPFADTNYFVTAINGQVDDAGVVCFATRSYSTTQFVYVAGYNGTSYPEPMMWYACGQGPIPS